MGVMRFRVFPTDRITEQMAQQAYLSGIDRACWPVRATIDDGQLVLQRAASDSGNLHVPWPVEGYGQLTVSSGSLMERAEPYLLPLELVRGTISQIRNQLSDWQSIGLSPPPTIATRLAEAVSSFSWAVVTQDQPAASAVHAEVALHAAVAAGDALAAAFAEQALAVRRRNNGKIASFLGADLGTTLLDNHAAKQFLVSFNAAKVPLCWRDTESTEAHFSWGTSDAQIQWCRAHGQKVLAGPLLTLDPGALPDWFYLFADDFESMLQCVSAFVRAAVVRYRGRVDGWICAGRLSAADKLTLSEPQRLRLVARTVELVRTLDPNTPTMVSFDQPWAEYMRQQESDFPPLQFADTLIRRGSELSALMLEINMGYSPGGTFLRHPLEFSRQLDVWSLFGLPLWLTVSAPSGHHDDQLAQHKASVPDNAWSPAAQQAWAARFVPLALAKPQVQGVIWNQYCDSDRHDFPFGGLLDEGRHAKPSLHTLAAIRKTYLK
jgi:hypothetical protein